MNNTIMTEFRNWLNSLISTHSSANQDITLWLQERCDDLTRIHTFHAMEDVLLDCQRHSFLSSTHQSKLTELALSIKLRKTWFSMVATAMLRDPISIPQDARFSIRCFLTLLNDILCNEKSFLHLEIETVLTYTHLHHKTLFPAILSRLNDVLVAQPTHLRLDRQTIVCQTYQLRVHNNYSERQIPTHHHIKPILNPVFAAHQLLRHAIHIYCDLYPEVLSTLQDYKQSLQAQPIRLTLSGHTGSVAPSDIPQNQIFPITPNTADDDNTPSPALSIVRRKQRQQPRYQPPPLPLASEPEQATPYSNRLFSPRPTASYAPPPNGCCCTMS